MDAYLAIVGKREVRRYLSKAIPQGILTQVIEAGRASGSSKNTQPWRFVLVTDRARLQALAPFVSRPSNVKGSAAAIVVTLLNPRLQFDAGRTAQNMMLAAWVLGVGSCPNTPMQEAAIKELLGLPAEAAVPTIISLGYPAAGEPRPRRAADPAGVLARINRLPLAELLHHGSFRA